MRSMSFELAVVFVNCILQLPVAMMLWRHHRDQPHWGLGLLSLTFVCSAVINLLFLLLPAFRSNAELQHQPWYLLPALLMGFSPMALMLVGLRRYFGDRLPDTAPGLLGLIAAMSAAMPLVSFLLRQLGIEWAPQAVVALVMSYCAWISWAADRREPGVGHQVLAAVCATAPAFLLLLLALDLDHQMLRSLSPLPFTMIGIVLLSVSLHRASVSLRGELQLRRQAELAYQGLSLELERRVEQRTAELRGVVEGLESFSRMVSHDLRGPLHGLSGLAKLAGARLEELDIARVSKFLGLMEAQTHELARLVEELLQLSRVSSGEFRRIEVQLGALAQEALSTLELTHGSVALSHVHVQALPTVCADPVLMRQVLINLIGNALKFSRHSEAPRIEVSVQRIGSEVELSVRDNGPGFPAAQAEALFEPFKRLHSGFEGSGIGLSIVKRIIDRHGGRVWAESAPGQGAVFHLRLPAG